MKVDSDSFCRDTYALFNAGHHGQPVALRQADDRPSLDDRLSGAASVCSWRNLELAII